MTRLLPAFEAFFFDFDGVIVDSVDIKAKVFARMFEPYGPEIVKKVVDYHFFYGGVTRSEKFEYYYREFLKKPLSNDGLLSLCEEFSGLVVDEVIKAPEIKGIEGFLKRWQRNIPLFVVSATPEEELREIILKRNLKEYFQEILGAPSGKSDNIRRIIQKYLFKPDRCLFFGDAENDYRSAQETGLRFLAVLPGVEAPLLKRFPDVPWINNFTEKKIHGTLKGIENHIFID